MTSANAIRIAIASVIALAMGGPLAATADPAEPETLFAPVPDGDSRAVLYEEDPNDPTGLRWPGSAIWRVEMEPPGAGRPSELSVRADVEIPRRRMSVRWTLRREIDLSSPISHTVDISFNTPPDFSPGGISDVPGVLMKQNELAKGVALVGQSVKVTAGVFLIGLSNASTDREHNMQLLKGRYWFDIPMVYNNNRRAILAVEKGTAGERAFEQAFAAWGK